MEYSRIQQLDPLLSNQIAAGEVVERPASIVKELVENSVDAKATKIEIDIEGGGKQFIRIRDNGFGIIKDDLVLAFDRHATSKIHKIQDLARIVSMGFRGEALASIASVAKCRLTSKTPDAQNAWQIEIRSDLTPEIVPAAHAVGTTIEVADLFYNTPARRKFLRSERTEFQAIEEVMKRLALAYPEISFSLKHENKLVRSYPAVSNLISESARVGKICGQQFLENALSFEEHAVGLQLRGWVGLPTISKRQADCQYFFVNNRAVRDRLLNHAVKTIYQQQAQMMEGTYPCYVLYLTLDPSEVDVNVHPTKQEVRFCETRLIHDFITKSLERVLGGSASYSIPCQKGDYVKKVPFFNPNPVTLATPSVPRYTLLEGEGGVYLISLLSAKKAVWANYFKQEAQNIEKKSLLFPGRFKLNAHLHDKHLSILNALGFSLKKVNAEWLLFEQPAFLKKEMSSESVLACLEALSKHGTKEALIAALGEHLTLEDLQSLPGETLNPLLLEWVKQTQKGPWLYFSHEEMLCNA